MYLYNGDGSNTLKSVFAPYPKEVEQGGYLNLQGLVKSREPYIAKVSGVTSFPWRIMVVSEMIRNWRIMIWCLNWLPDHRVTFHG